MMQRPTNPFVALALVVALGSPNADAQLAAPEYGIREDTARTGSLIRRNAVTSSQVPLNRRYQELSAEEKAIVHAYYVRIEPGDEPPFPAEGLRPIYDAIRRAQAKLLVKGPLSLVVEVGANGEATEVSALESPSKDMTNFAGGVLLLTKFKPAVCAGNPCRMQFPLYMFLSITD